MKNFLSASTIFIAPTRSNNGVGGITPVRYINNTLSLYIRYAVQAYLKEDRYLEEHIKPVEFYNPMEWLTTENDLTSAFDISDCFFYKEKEHRFSDIEKIFLRYAQRLFTAAVLYVHALNLPPNKKTLFSVHSLFTDKKIWNGEELNFDSFKKRLLLKMYNFKVGSLVAISEKALKYIHDCAHFFLTIPERDAEVAVIFLVHETKVLEDPIVRKVTESDW